MKELGEIWVDFRLVYLVMGAKTESVVNFVEYPTKNYGIEK